MSSDDLTVTWYTYSTISQTLAGAFGFLTAVCLYQMQCLTRQLEKRGSDYLLGEINHPAGGGDHATFLLRSGRFKAFTDYIAKHGFTDKHGPFAKEAQDTALEQFNIIYADYSAIKCGLQASLSPTVITIIAALFFLAVTNPRMLSWFWPAWAILFLVFLGAVYCIMTYVNLAETIVVDDGFTKLRSFLRRIQHRPSDNE